MWRYHIRLRLNQPRPNVIAIDVSDVHIGAIGGNHSQFTYFLTQISNATLYPNLKLLIIGGDFFDVFFASNRGLREHYRECFDLLQKLQERGVEIVLVLGNHEIPVTPPYNPTSQIMLNPNAGLDYNLDVHAFRERKEELRQKLGSEGVLGNFILNAKLCQYAVLERSENDWKVMTFDSIQDLSGSPTFQIVFPASRPMYVTRAVKILVGHGFQCEPHTGELAEMWEKCLNIPIHLKGIFDVLYYVFRESLQNALHPNVWAGDSPNIKNYRKMDAKARKELNKLHADLKNDPEKHAQLREYHQAITWATNRKRGLEGAKICDYAAAFLANHVECKNITHFLFGHTHNVFDKKIGSVRIINTGAWHRVRVLTHVEWDEEGNYRIIEIPSKSFIRSRLVGFIIIILIVVTIFVGIFH